MAGAKAIIIKPITARVANPFVVKVHYSHKIVANSNLHFGVFYNGVLHGVMSFGPSINKKATMHLVKGTGWNEFIELNRLAFDDVLPKNSESRAISVAIKLIRKNAPHIKWLISFADATQCGHGTIYQAAGFKLVGIAKNTALRINPQTKELVHIIQAHHLKIQSKEFRSWEPIKGYMLKYVYFIKPEEINSLTVPILPYSAIKDAGAAMYKGMRR